jgi:hypothetical protein
MTGDKSSLFGPRRYNVHWCVEKSSVPVAEDDKDPLFWGLAIGNAILPYTKGKHAVVWSSLCVEDGVLEGEDEILTDGADLAGIFPLKISSALTDRG